MPNLVSRRITLRRQFMKQWEAEVISHISKLVNLEHKTLEQTFASVDLNGDGNRALG